MPGLKPNPLRTDALFRWTEVQLPLLKQGAPTKLGVEHSGFRVVNAGVGDLELVAVSDVDPARLLELVGIIKGVQAGGR